MKINKKSIQTKILENWYVIDSILLNGHAKEKIKSAKLFEQYTSLKAAFLNTLFEFYNHINYIPNYDKKIENVKQLTEHAVISAKYSKKLAANILHKEDVRIALKNKIIQEAKSKSIKNMNVFSDAIIQEKFIQLSLDNALIGIPVIEAKKKKAFDDFKGEILEESYRMYRNAIMQLALTCMKK